MEVSAMSESVAHKSDEKHEFPLYHFDTYEVLERLDRLQDHINFAEAYGREVVNRIYKKRYSGITINFTRSLDISRIMDHLGPGVQSLALKLSVRDNYTVENLVTIQQKCEQLKNLTIIEFDRSGHEGDQDHPFSENFSDKLENLFLSNCQLANDDNFFDCFNIGKSLTMLGCENISATAMQRCFEKNQEIESFACNSRTLEYSKFIHLLPNLKRLGLSYDSQISEPDFMLTVQSLRSLALDCDAENVNQVLFAITLNENINLEHLELNNVLVDGATFEILTKFSKLYRLIINTSREYEFMMADKLPSKLKSLMLAGFRISEPRMNLLIDHEILSIRVTHCTYDTFGRDTLEQWIKRRSKSKKGTNVTFAAGHEIPQAPSTITLNDFSGGAFTFNKYRMDFPALSSSRLTDIEQEVDTYNE